MKILLSITQNKLHQTAKRFFNSIHINMKNFTKAMDRFQNIDGDNFGPCYTEGNFGHYYLETRARKQDGKLCIVMYYPNRSSYEIFVQED